MVVIEFNAEYVEVSYEEFTPEFTVIGIHFGQGDPENDGQFWNFSRSIGEDEDQGVCTVKEIQEIVLYSGISSFTLYPSKLICKFKEISVEEMNVKKLIVHFELSPEKWNEITKAAKKVFKGESYFNIENRM